MRPNWLTRALLPLLLLLNVTSDVEAQQAAQSGELAAAVRNGDVNAVRRLVQRGVDVNAFWKDSVGNEKTPLMLAAEAGQTEIAKLLLENDADPNAQRLGKATALILAANRGAEAVVEDLLKSGADANAATQYGATPLINAAARGHTNIVRVLLEHGADVNAKMKTPFDSTGKTAITIAAERGNKEVVGLLRAHNGAAKKVDPKIDELLNKAAENRTLIAGILIEKTAKELVVEVMSSRYRFSVIPETRILDEKGSPARLSQLKIGQSVAVAINRGRLMEVYTEGLSLKVESLKVVRLRSKPESEFMPRDVSAMLKQRAFFSADHKLYPSAASNPAGTGISNVLVLNTWAGIVVDMATGLMWQQSGSPRLLSYEDAMIYVDSLNAQRLGGFADWRLPTLEEGMSLVQPRARSQGANTLFDRSPPLHVDKIFDSQLGFWTSDAAWGNLQWSVQLLHGTCVPQERGSSLYQVHVRAVRSDDTGPRTSRRK